MRYSGKDTSKGNLLRFDKHIQTQRTFLWYPRVPAPAQAACTVEILLDIARNSCSGRDTTDVHCLARREAAPRVLANIVSYVYFPSLSRNLTRTMYFMLNVFVAFIAYAVPREKFTFVASEGGLKSNLSCLGKKNRIVSPGLRTVVMSF